MTAEGLALIVGVILSLVFSYVPGLNVKFAALGPEVKRLIMLGLLALVSLVSFGISCAGAGEVFGISLVCDATGAYGLIRVFATAAIANQSAFVITPQLSSVKAVRG